MPKIKTNTIRIYDVLNLGAGWQSSRILLGMCRGEIPRPDAAIFADTQWKPRAVYENLEFLKSECEKAAIPLIVRTRGDLRADAIEFRRSRKSSDGKRFASIPVFTRNPDGSKGRVRRQCTSEYKIKVVDSWIRRELLGLLPKSRIPPGVVVNQWFGISDNEASRAVFPGRFSRKMVVIGKDLFGESVMHSVRKWRPDPRRRHVYPLLNEVWYPDRTIHEISLLPNRESRVDCGSWLATHYADRYFPRSACVGCPFQCRMD